MQNERQIQSYQVMEELKRRLQIIRLSRPGGLPFFENADSEYKIKRAFEDHLHMVVTRSQVSSLSKLEEGKTAQRVLNDLCQLVAAPKFDF